MRISRADIIDWEPAILTLSARRGNSLGAGEVSSFFRRWLLHREKLKICPCFDKYLSVRQLSRSSVKVACEWLCDTCFERLTEDIAKSISKVVAIKLGVDSTEDEPQQRFIQIPTRTALFEDGSMIVVESFVISQQPVSVSAFEKFVFASNYLTTAERQGRSESFREHFGLSGFSARERARLPATMVSYDDAQAYCKWAGLRLPSEAEVLSAALIDNEVYGDADDDELDEYLRSKWKQSMEEGTVIAHGAKLTSTLTTDGVVIRSGPFPFLTAGWEKRRERNRETVAPDYYDMVLEFHVCK